MIEDRCDIFFKQKTAYEMRISDWSSDVCSSDLESFTFIESALILSIVVLGGMGSQVGVILAAIILTVVPELAREFAQYRMLVFGLVMVLMMMWRPQGLLPVKRPQVELKT